MNANLALKIQIQYKIWTRLYIVLLLKKMLIHIVADMNSQEVLQMNAWKNIKSVTIGLNVFRIVVIKK